MRIAFLTQALPYVPSVGGFRLYAANLIRSLSRRHEIELISFTEGEDPEHVAWPRQYCASVTMLPDRRHRLPSKLANLVSTFVAGRPAYAVPALRSVLKAGFESSRWDVLHVEGDFVASFVPPLGRCARILSVHDAWGLRCDEMLKCELSTRDRLYYTMLRYHQPRYQRLVYPRFERCVVVAEADRAAVQRVVPGVPVVVVPNGIDTEYFQPGVVRAPTPTIAFHGHLGYAPNVDAVLSFASDVLPRISAHWPDVVFHVIGADPDPRIVALASRSVIRLSASPPDVRPALAGAHVYVCPVRYGSGVKNKLLEAMASGIPVVSSPASTAGLDCTPGEHLLVAGDPEEFAAHVHDLLAEPGRAGRLAQAARRLVVEGYSWESRARLCETLYEEVIDERRRGVPRRVGRAGGVR